MFRSRSSLRRTRTPPHVVHVSEGCGKTALLRQAMEALEKEFGHHVVYTNPLAKTNGVLEITPSIKDIVEEILKAFPDPYSKIVDVAISVAHRVIMGFRGLAPLLSESIGVLIELTNSSTGMLVSKATT